MNIVHGRRARFHVRQCAGCIPATAPRVIQMGVGEEV